MSDGYDSWLGLAARHATDCAQRRLDFPKPKPKPERPVIFKDNAEVVQKNFRENARVEPNAAPRPADRDAWFAKKIRPYLRDLAEELTEQFALIQNKEDARINAKIEEKLAPLRAELDAIKTRTVAVLPRRSSNVA